ncbi:efflux RND transporter periplasmic adaptor subunit [Runella salmonicolor]|uniref:Efflux RND transporter periplasmic adaptor subunit n=1 Tax=Runella salmonicolor TaxID=2950278 RepID=A0ABT1FXS2_9BACT|nr:efflux RND transporter periplasmic adaptor subunit [Runella salmonicolor]MCP1386575.1 efflux RND transporter periplasmic adaptor subunit [Runella salmonicolor]
MKKNWKKGKLFPWLIVALLGGLTGCDFVGQYFKKEVTQPQEAYACPMKCEGNKTYNAPGSCPVCGMDLVKVTSHSSHADTAVVMMGQRRKTGKKYYCTMKCEGEKTYDAPGQCPVCGMDLVEKKETTADEQLSADDSLAILVKPTYEYVLSGVKTVQPQRRSQQLVVNAFGFLSYDAQALSSIATRFGGRIERLYVRYPFQTIRKGQKIMDIYSPDLVTAQQNLIFLLQNDAENQTLIDNARQRLLLLGLTSDQLKSVEQSKKPIMQLSIYSPYSGIIVERSAGEIPMPSGGSNRMNEGMGGSKSAAQIAPPPSTTKGELTLKEGMYVQKGQRLFEVQNTHSVWAMLEFYPTDVPKVKVGQSVMLELEGDSENQFFGKINYLEPLITTNNRNPRARVYVPNPSGKLKIGSLVKASINAGTQNALWVPSSALLDMGREKMAFVRKAGVFRSRTVQTGLQEGNWVEVLSGLTSEETFAENAQFLMDSESFVKSNELSRR